MKQRYTIKEAIEATTEALRGHYDQSATTIRCALNDHLDLMAKDGFKVNFDFNQDRAVKAVRTALFGH